MATQHDPAAALMRMLDGTVRERAKRRQDLDQLQKAADDYEDLEASLAGLPSKVEHQILVPFGKMAFFPGTLRHTNEVMVLLGDNYFALRSAEQAAAIAHRRAEYVRPQVAAAQSEIDVLTSRIKQIRAYSEAQDVQAGTFEIREPYESDDDAECEEVGMPVDDDDDSDLDDLGSRPSAELLQQEPRRSSSFAAPMRPRTVDSDDDTDDDGDGKRPTLPPLARRAVHWDQDIDRKAHVQALPAPMPDRDAGKRRDKGAHASASSRTPSSTRGAPVAFAEDVVEREPAGTTPSDVDITIREMSRQAAQQQQSRAMRTAPERATDSPGSDMRDSTAADLVTVSRFKANRMRSTM